MNFGFQYFKDSDYSFRLNHKFPGTPGFILISICFIRLMIK